MKSPVAQDLGEAGLDLLGDLGVLRPRGRRAGSVVTTVLLGALQFERFDELDPAGQRPGRTPDTRAGEPNQTRPPAHRG